MKEDLKTVGQALQQMDILNTKKYIGQTKHKLELLMDNSPNNVSTGLGQVSEMVELELGEFKASTFDMALKGEAFI